MNEYVILFILVILLPVMLTGDGYKVPSEKIQEIYDIPPLPYMQFLRFEDSAIELEYTRDIRLKDLSGEELGLAGEKLNPAINGLHDYYPVTSIKYVDIQTSKKHQLSLPENLRITGTEFSPHYKKLAITYEESDGIYLGIYDLDKDRFTEIKDLRLNDALGSELQWYNDGRHLLAQGIVQDRGNRPKENLLPQKPLVQETYGKTSQTRTYTNLLQNSHDEDLFEYYFTGQPVLVDAKKGRYKEIGNPGIYSWLELSPDNEYILAGLVKKPYSRELPWYRFPREYQIWDKKGKLIRELYSRPMMDEVPIGGVYPGPRNFEWIPQMPASLVWVEALDGGDPKKKVEYRDKLVFLGEIESGESEELLRLEQRIRRINWSQIEGEFIIYEYDRDKLWLRGWLVNFLGDKMVKVEDRSIQDQYNYPGNFVTRKNQYNRSVFIKEGDHVYYINSKGASPEGRFPYLAKQNIITGEQEILFKCREGHFESPVCFIDDAMSKIAVSSQTHDKPRNYYVFDVDTKQIEWLTSYQNPYPDWAILPKQVINYQRADSVSLSGTLYLPPEWDGKTRLPLVINAYPEEYTNSSTAGQNAKTADRFTYFSGASVRYFAFAGYAVLAEASIPIIGNPETVNETFVDQTCMSVEAAITHLSEEGIIDVDKVGITGHSYGAFMVANTLAHSDLCRAGIARSGAYNRTLTPFGFQSERRTFWQAKDFYIKVSPFMNADQIKEPILLVHGEDDDNSGTYPIQSQRFYDAIKGNGGTARLVMLPLEEHGYRARESNLHVIEEMIEWFDRYVKPDKLDEKEND